MRRFSALLTCFGLVIAPAALCATTRTQADEADWGTRPTVAVSDFPGDDRALSSFLSETLLTDLSHSSRIQTLERTEVRQAMADLDIRDSGPVTPSQVRHLGELIHASRLVVGSFMVRDDQVVINVRMLNTQTGLNVPGSAYNVMGPRKSLLTVSHKLAQQLHRKLTGEDLILDEETRAPIATSELPDKAPGPFLQEESDPLDNGKRLGLIPAAARPNGPLAERDLAGFLSRLAKRVATDNVLHLEQTAGPISRMQALTGVVKLIVAGADMAAIRAGSSGRLTPDGAQIPLWGQPYLAAALDQGWWDPNTPLRPRDAATWGFLEQVLAKLPLVNEAPRVAAPRAIASRPLAPRFRDEAPAASELFTGLVVDVRDFELKRDHSPRIVDEDGVEVYPDPKHCPTPDFVDQNGMAGYATSDTGSHRSGAHPLVVRAVGVTGPGPFDVVISNEDARRIAEANRRSKFLWKWNVTMVVGE